MAKTINYQQYFENTALLLATIIISLGVCGAGLCGVCGLWTNTKLCFCIKKFFPMLLLIVLLLSQIAIGSGAFIQKAQVRTTTHYCILYSLLIESRGIATISLVHTEIYGDCEDYFLC